MSDTNCMNLQGTTDPSNYCGMQGWQQKATMLHVATKYKPQVVPEVCVSGITLEGRDVAMSKYISLHQYAHAL